MRLHNANKYFSEETRNKLREAKLGKHRSEAVKQKIREAKLGKHWWNNGKIEIFSKNCPEGFIKGRIYKKRRKRS